jgi:hypothetical protein
LKFPEKSARRQLLQIGFDLAGPPPDMDPVKGFLRLLGADLDVADFWATIACARTPQEEVRAYRDASGTSIIKEDFPTLGAQKEWLELVNAAKQPFGSKGVVMMDKYDDVCPKCHLSLPTSEASRLQRFGIARAYSCCSRILLCDEL